MGIQVWACLLSVPRNRYFLPYWPVRAELFLRIELGEQKASALSICIQGFKRAPSTRKKICSHVKQSSGTAEVDTASRNVFQRLPLTWQALLWVRPSIVCTTLSLTHIRCHLAALSPYSITAWQLSQYHHFLLLYCLLCVSSSFSPAPLPVLLCPPGKAVQGAHPSNPHPAMKRAIWSGHVAELAGTERTRCQQPMFGLADVVREPHTTSVFSIVHVLGQACIKTCLLPKVCIMYSG